ncbi:MAG: protease HtpX [bacterium]
MSKRFFLFVVVNIFILVTISIVLQVLGVRPYINAYGIDYSALMIFCLVWGMGGAFISLGLSRIIAKRMMGVQVINPDEGGAAGELVRMVHGLAASAGLPKMPEVGIYDSPEVNAFATGPTRSRALVAVSSGLLSGMNRSQLEGVLSHEIAHVANGDMITMTLLQGVVNAFVLFLARVIAFFVTQNVKEESRRMVTFLVTIVLQIILSVLGSMVVAFFSRHREFRADAGGARLAGRDKMINALKGLRSTRDLTGAKEHPDMATLKISGKSGGFMTLLTSHPPLEERIARLESFQV